MIHNLRTASLFPVVLTLVSFGSGVAKATAQTTYPFSGNYSTQINIIPITKNVSRSVELGKSTDAPYGLTQYAGLVYAESDPTTGKLTFNTDPATFGLDNLPIGYIQFTGADTNNTLGGTATASAVTDLASLTGKGFGTLNVTSGAGLFTNATGTLNFSETDIINPDPKALSLNGQAVITGSIAVVPEPETEIGTLAAIGLIGTSILLRRHRQRSTLSRC